MRASISDASLIPAEVYSNIPLFLLNLKGSSGSVGYCPCVTTFSIPPPITVGGIPYCFTSVRRRSVAINSIISSCSSVASPTYSSFGYKKPNSLSRQRTKGFSRNFG